MEPTRENVMAEVDEVLATVNEGRGATAADIVQLVRVRLPRTTAAVVDDVLATGVVAKKYFRYILPNMTVAYCLEGSWMAEEAALSAFIDMTS